MKFIVKFGVATVVGGTLSHPLRELRVGTSSASTTTVVVPFASAAVVASSPPASVFTVGVVSTPAASLPAPSSASVTFHDCCKWGTV